MPDNHDVPASHQVPGGHGAPAGPDGNRDQGGAAPRLDAESARESLFLAPERTERPPWERRLLAAATPLRLTAEVSAVSWGAGRPVLLVHGWQGRGTQLGQFVGPLVRAGRRVIAVDAPGHGDSPVGWFTPVAFADALLGVKEESGALDGIVAHSMGAVAVMAAVRGGLRTSSVALIAPIRSFTGMVRRSGRSLGYPPGTPEGAEYLRLASQALGRPLADLDLDLGVMGGARVLLAQDADDETVPAASTRQLARDWPDAAFVETTGLGHAGILVDPAVVGAVVSHITAARATSPSPQPSA
jgi:pimeloyl-ACP methyl ester carboxylesterase